MAEGKIKYVAQDLRWYLVPVLGWVPLLNILFLSALTGLALALSPSRNTAAQTYQDLVVGPVTWTAANKAYDYYAILLFFVLFSILSVSLNTVYRYFERRTVVPDSRRWLDAVLLISLCPIAWAIGSHLVGVPPSRSFLLLAAIFAAVSCLICLALTRYADHISETEVADISGSVFGILVAGLGAAFSVVIVLWKASLTRPLLAHSLWNHFAPTMVWRLAAGALLVSAAVVFFVFAVSKSATSLRARLLNLLLVIQLPLPFLYLALIPPPWNKGGQLYAGYRTTTAFHAVLALTIIASIFGWYRHWRYFRRSADNDARSLSAAIVPWSALSLVVFAQIKQLGLPILLLDDYHIGEWYLPWQQLAEFGKLPFVDLNYPHGVVHLVQGFMGWAFFDTSASSFFASDMLLSACACAATFLSIYAIFGPAWAFLVGATFPVASFTHNHWFTAPAVLVLIHPSLLRRPIRWLFVWVSVAIGLVFYSMSTGTAFTLASLPCALWMISRSWRETRKPFIRYLLLTLVIVIPLLLLTPVGSVLVGLIRYLLENSSVHATANSTAWLSTFGSPARNSGMMNSGLISELFRMAWTLAVVAAATVVWREAFRRGDEKRADVFIFGIILVLYPLFLAAYSFGRIDPGDSRGGLVSVWMLSLALPLLLLLAWRGKFRSALVIWSAVSGAGFFSLLSGALPALPDIKSLSIRSVATVQMVEGQRVSNSALPNLGRLVLEENRLKELLELQQVLRELLRPGETYLDLTNHSARYFFLGYPVPVQEAAFYNAASTPVQKKMLHQLSLAPPPVVLIEGDNIIWDGVTLPLRASHLYRHLLSSYTPIKRGGYIFMVEPRRAAGLAPVELENQLRLSSLSNQDWIRGIWRDRQRNAILSKHAVDLWSVSPGDKVVLRHSGERTITKIADRVLLLDGPPLDPLGDGHPQTAEVRRQRPCNLSTFPEALNNTRMALLESAFPVPHLGNIPTAWGRSWKTLERLLIPTAKFTPDTTWQADGSSTGATRTSSGYPVIFKLGTSGLRGKDAQYLGFQLQSPGGDEDTHLVIRWIDDQSQVYDEKKSLHFSARAGFMLVPVDVHPRWLLSDRLTEIRIELMGSASGTIPNVTEVRFYKRRDGNF